MKLNRRKLRQLIAEATADELGLGDHFVNYTGTDKAKTVAKLKQKLNYHMGKISQYTRVQEFVNVLKVITALKIEDDAAAKPFKAKFDKEMDRARARFPSEAQVDFLAGVYSMGKAQFKDEAEDSRIEDEANSEVDQMLADAEASARRLAQEDEEWKRAQELLNEPDPDDEFHFTPEGQRAIDAGVAYDDTEEEKKAKYAALDAKQDTGQASPKPPPAIGTIIKNQTQGDMFRMWVNAKYESYARKINLDEEGSYKNTYIKKAWAKYGKAFIASDNYKNVQVGDSKIPFSKLGTPGYTGDEGDGAIRVQGQAPLSENKIIGRWQVLAGI